MGLNKCLPPLTRIPWYAGWTTNVSIFLTDNVIFLLPFRVSKLRSNSQSGCGRCIGMSKSLWKPTSYVIFIPTPNTAVTRGDVGEPTEGKSLQICNYLFLTMVLPLGSILVYGVAVHFQNRLSKPVSATKCRLPFHFPSHLHTYKEILLLVFLCVFQDTSRVGVHFPFTADQDKVILPAQQSVSLGTPWTNPGAWICRQS